MVDWSGVSSGAIAGIGVGAWICGITVGLALQLSEREIMI